MEGHLGGGTSHQSGQVGNEGVVGEHGDALEPLGLPGQQFVPCLARVGVGGERRRGFQPGGESTGANRSRVCTALKYGDERASGA